MWTLCVKVTVLLLIQLGMGQKNGPRLRVGKGELLGSWKKSLSGRMHASFEGLPYALPPIGARRFEDPVECEDFSSLTKTIDATVMTDRCLQIEVNAQGEVISGKEDCLYLAVYTNALTQSENPAVNTSANFPVMIYIHGGGFTCGCGNCSTPDLIMDNDIVYVTFNYRVGFYGYLSTEDDVIPGNMGMKDQVLVLRWVKRNIHYFGGNPNSVTIIGLSSGGSSVDMHYLSPMSKGLFHRGYSQSGSSLNPYAICMDALGSAKKVAADVNCTTKTTKEMVECFRHTSPQKILRSTKQFKRGASYYFLGFGPVVEIPHKNAFLSMHPYRYLETGNFSALPWIVSNTADEGIVAIAAYYDDLNYVDQNWISYSADIFSYKWNVPKYHLSEIARKVKQFYTDGEPINKDTYKGIIEAAGDRMFSLSNQQSILLHSRNARAPVYYYKFSYRGVHSLSELFMKNPRNLGVTHSDDSIYIMSNPLLDTKTSESDKEMSHLLVNMLYTYAVDGKPRLGSFSWEPLDGSDKIKFVDIISPRKLVKRSLNNSAKMRFWSSMGVDRYEKFIPPTKDELKYWKLSKIHNL